MSIMVTVAGEPIPTERLWKPEMSLSSSRELGRPERYELTIPADRFLAALEPLWDACARELRADDELVGVNDELGAADYPSLKELLACPDRLTEAVNPYLAEALFATFLPPLVRTGPGTCAVDTIEAVVVIDDQVVVRGDCVCF